MAAALSADDSPELHAADTLTAGAGLCDPMAVDILTREGPAAVRALAALGAPFDRSPDGSFAQSLEAAHSRARVARVGGDGAGAAIMQAVIAAVRGSPHIEVREGARVTALIQDHGGRILGALAWLGGRLIEIRAAATVLATGGLGGLYAVTTNPAAARGEGLALAWRVGAEIVDPEFVQFHPTALDVGSDPAPLATEALRGEGARHCGELGRRTPVVDHPLADLAPRDVVARAIRYAEIARGGRVFLDAREARWWLSPVEFPARSSSLPAAPSASTRGRSPAPRSPLRTRLLRQWAGSRGDALPAARPLPDCSPLAKSPAAACRAPIAWPPTRCWRRLSSAVELGEARRATRSPTAVARSKRAPRRSCRRRPWPNFAVA